MVGISAAHHFQVADEIITIIQSSFKVKQYPSPREYNHISLKIITVCTLISVLNWCYICSQSGTYVVCMFKPFWRGWANVYTASMSVDGTLTPWRVETAVKEFPTLKQIWLSLQRDLDGSKLRQEILYTKTNIIKSIKRSWRVKPRNSPHQKWYLVYEVLDGSNLFRASAEILSIQRPRETNKSEGQLFYLAALRSSTLFSVKSSLIACHHRGGSEALVGFGASTEALLHQCSPLHHRWNRRLTSKVGLFRYIKPLLVYKNVGDTRYYCCVWLPSSTMCGMSFNIDHP